MLPLSCSHWAAYSWSLRSRACCEAAVVGTGSMSWPAATVPPVPVPPVAAESTGLLRPTPRGSNETMSNRSSSPGERTDSSLARSSIPELPGPPGLITSEPIRSVGISAGCRATAICRVGPSGS